MLFIRTQKALGPDGPWERGVSAAGAGDEKVSAAASPFKKKVCIFKGLRDPGRGGDRKAKGLFPGPCWGGAEKGGQTKVKEEGL